MTKRKSSQDNTVDLNKTNKVVDFYTDLFTLRERPINEAFIERLASELVTWAIHQDEATSIKKFFMKRGINPSKVDKLRERFSCLQEAYEVALLAIGERRNDGALEKKYSEGMVRYLAPLYSKELKELEEWRAGLRRVERDDSGGVRYVVLEGLGTTAAVESEE